MYSSEGERVQLIQHISTSEAKGAVEKWLVQVEDLMLRSVRDVVARSRVVRSLFPIASIIHSTVTCLICYHQCCLWVMFCFWIIWGSMCVHKCNIVLTGLRWDCTEPVGKGMAWTGGALHLSDILDLGGSWSHQSWGWCRFLLTFSPFLSFEILLMTV